MNEFKTLDWSYPTSPNAERFGFKRGCWTVSLCDWTAPVDGGALNPPVAVKAFPSRLEALRFAGSLPQPWGRIWKYCAEELAALEAEAPAEAQEQAA